MNPVSIATEAQLTTANGMLTNIFSAIINFMFTIIDVMVNFLTQTEVLGALAVIAVVYMVYRKLRTRIRF